MSEAEKNHFAMTDTAPDDLDKPLGQKKKTQQKKRLVLPWLKLAGGSTGATVAALALALIFIRNPLGGEPIGLASIDVSQVKPLSNAQQPTITEQKLTAPEPKGPTINIVDATTGKAQEVEIAPPERSSKVDARLVEKGKHGALPIIGTDGTRPLDIYGLGFRAKTAAEATKPKIGIIIGGLGISTMSTNEAINRMPGGVTLAFAPYGNDLDAQVAKARGTNHEVLLQLPMEPFDYPDNDPGPQTLLTSLAADRNLERLSWAMSRFGGYVGVMNYMGAKFTSSENALTPVLRDTAKRGLLFVDDGSSARSMTDHVASLTKTPYLKSDLTLDRVPTPAELDAQLTKLEQVAKEKGTAIGVGTALPVTLERVQNWAKTLEKKGFVLVPLTGLLGRREPS